jgi:hypothetical protein
MHQVINQINIIQLVDRFIDESELLKKNISESSNEEIYVEYLENVISIFRNMRLNLIRCEDGIDTHHFKNILSTCKDLNDIEFDISFLEKFNNLLESYILKKVDFFLFFFSKYNFEKEQLHTLDKVIPIIKYYKKINNIFNDLEEDNGFSKKLEEKIIFITRLSIREKYFIIKQKVKQYNQN